MKKEKEQIQRKLALAKEKLAEIEVETAKLEAQIEPIRRKLAESQEAKKYLEGRVVKLEKMLTED